MAGGEKMMEGVLNQLMDGLRKMEIKLNCAICSGLVQEPKLLPCNHVFCRNCIMNIKSNHCPQCNSKILSNKDVKEAPYIEQMVEIYNNFSSLFKELELNNNPLLAPPGIKRLKRSREEEGLYDKIERNLMVPFEMVPKKNSSKIPIGLFPDECAFCHSFRTTKLTGEMLYYQKGRLISAEEADKSNSKVIYVHQSCFQWTPKVYFEGEKVQNLEKEISRANKLTCEKCRKKGAALGCYSEKCDKSYHATCALKILNCRWDQENYNMLCPAHVNENLKCDEKAKKESHIMETNNMDCSEKEKSPNNQNIQKDIIQDEISLQKNKHKFVLFCSALSTNEKGLVEEFASKSNGIVIERWQNDVTHIITVESALSSSRRIRRTNEVMLGILLGIWIVTIDWIEECLENESVVSEESFELNEDFYGVFEGPRKGRMRVAQKVPNLFARLGFSLSSHLSHDKKKLVEDLVTAGGGKITNKDKSLDLNAKRRNLTNYLVYDDVNSQGCSSSERNKEFLEFGKKEECSRLVKYSRVLEAVGVFDSEILNKEWYQDS